MVEPALPTLATVVITALIDSINPCAIGVMILLLSTLLATKQNDRIFRIGIMYILVVALTYLAFGLGLTAFLSRIPLVISEYISIGVGLMIVFLGLVEIKDYYWYGRGFSLMMNLKQAHKIKQRMKHLSFGTVLLLGIFVASVELPCTGGPYLAITVILGQNFSFNAFLLLLLYNAIFVLPMVIILIAVAGGKKVQDVLRWKQMNKAYMRYLTGLLMIALGWLLMLMANGTINLT